VLTLYYRLGCPYSLRARLALAEKQLPFGRRIVGVNRPHELDDLSGGKVPVLLEDSFVVKESTVIAEYLEERFPRPALLRAGRSCGWR
jgi:glutathione S-transferase